MFYTIYKITNLVNGKFYIGKHQTNNLDDNYFGSGKRLRNAIKHYGLENFKKEILEVFDTEAKMNLAEKILVVPDPEVSYNLCPGGHGGFGYINEYLQNGMLGKKQTNKQKNIARSSMFKLRKKINIKETSSKGGKISKGFLRKHHTEESKQKIGDKNSKHQSGNKNSQYGLKWITNGLENRKVKKDLTILPEGFYNGRNLRVRILS